MTTSIKQGSIILKPIAAPSPWQAFLLPVSGFPIGENEIGSLCEFVRALSIHTLAEWNLSLEAFLQYSQIVLGDGRARLVANGREWIPEMGLGVWPDREPPSLWTMADFENADMDGTMRPLMFQVFRVSTTQEAKLQAADVLLDLGAMILALVRGNPESFFDLGRTNLQSMIKEAALRCFPFYVPLLDCHSLLSASSEDLEKWLCGASVYIRQSAEDKGIIIISQQELNSLFQKLGGRFQETPAQAWYFQG
jgi:hypothetical protein